MLQNLAVTRVLNFDMAYLNIAYLVIFFLIAVLTNFKGTILHPITIIGGLCVLLSSAAGGFQGNRGAIIITMIHLSICFYFLNYSFKINYENYLKITVYFTLINLIIAWGFIIFNYNPPPPWIERYAFQKRGLIITYISGLYSDKNALGYFTGLILLLIQFSYRGKFRIYLILFLLITLILSGNRGGMLAYFFAFFVYKTIGVKSKKQRTIYIILIPIIAFLFLKFWTASDFDERKGSDSGRKELREIAYPIVRNNLWFGIGRSLVMDGESLQVHNFYLQVLVEQGLISLIFYLLLFIYFYFKTSSEGKALLIFVYFFILTAPIMTPGNLGALEVMLGFCFLYSKAKKENTLNQVQVL